MTRILILILLSLSICPALLSQTYTGSGGIIPDNGTPISFTINVTELPVSSIDTIYGLESVCINLIHTWDADLEMVLIAPDDSYVDLAAGLGGGDDNYMGTCFNGNSDSSIIRAWAPFTGTFRPIGDLGVVNNGQSGTGTWQLYILDTYPYADQGLLINWSLTFSDEPSKPFPFESSNLPLILINTFGQFIPDNPKIMAHMGIIDNGPEQRNYLTDSLNGYDGLIGIERRGSSSQGFPKKSYGFETWDDLGGEINVSLLGMPEESDWILNAHYSDKTLMRNVLTYNLSNKIGQYAARTRFCELFLNDQYWGVYAFMEKIKRDDNRVDIAKLDPGDTTGVNLTGGYILKIDKISGSGGEGWYSTFLPPIHPQGQTIYYQYEYPEYADLQQQQINYIQNYVDTFETKLFDYQPGGPRNYADYLDIGSCIDYFILNELSRNIDGYRLSTFFYKDRGGKLVMGPLWDFDLAWNNADYCEATNYQGWAYKFGDFCPDDTWQLPFWWDKLLSDPDFTHELRCRWESLRMTSLDLDSLFEYINGQVDTLDEAQQRNFIQWPILGIWVWPNPWPIPTTYAGEISNLKLWIFNRLFWLDNNIPGECPDLSIPEKTLSEIEIYPNPFDDQLNILLRSGRLHILKAEIINVFGQVVKSEELSNNPALSAGSIIIIRTSDFSKGIYFLEVTTENRQLSRKVLKIN